MLPEAKVMYEIFRESAYDGRYQVVYYTELDEKNRDYWIGRAMQGETFIAGFLPVAGLERFKRVVDEVIDDLNNGGLVSVEQAEERIFSTECS